MITRDTHTIDATGKSIGRLASEVVSFLRGKNKPSWQPHIDAGDFVSVVNVDKVKITGSKLTKKIYYTHSNYPGGLREETLRAKIAKKGHQDALSIAVYNMLPKNKLRNEMMKRLTITPSEQQA